MTFKNWCVQQQQQLLALYNAHTQTLRYFVVRRFSAVAGVEFWSFSDNQIILILLVLAVVVTPLAFSAHLICVVLLLLLLSCTHLIGLFMTFLLLSRRSDSSAALERSVSDEKKLWEGC